MDSTDNLRRICPECGERFVASRVDQFYCRRLCGKRVASRRNYNKNKLKYLAGEEVPDWFIEIYHKRKKKVDGKCYDCNRETKKFRCRSCNKTKHEREYHGFYTKKQRRD